VLHPNSGSLMVEHPHPQLHRPLLTTPVSHSSPKPMITRMDGGPNGGGGSFVASPPMSSAESPQPLPHPTATINSNGHIYRPVNTNPGMTAGGSIVGISSLSNGVGINGSLSSSNASNTLNLS